MPRSPDAPRWPLPWPLLVFLCAHALHTRAHTMTGGPDSPLQGRSSLLLEVFVARSLRGRRTL